MNEYEKKASDLVRKMGDNLALRFVNANIAHWQEDELIVSRTESEDYWEIVKENLSKHTNFIIREQSELAITYIDYGTLPHEIN